MFELFKKSREILGMNARNLTYIRPHNKKRARRIADEKILSKKILKKANIPVPGLIAKIKSERELEEFDWQALPNSFALKPNRGFGGEGIIVVFAKKKSRDDAWIKADGSLVTIEDLKNHIRNIIDGSFSLANTPDTAFFEERLKLIKTFKPYCFRGIPDIRVIVFNKVPVMAMLRLPTKESGGKANLQQGAIGVGIDMATGTTTTAVYGKSRRTEYIPNTRLLVSGIKIPYWQEILRLAVKSHIMTGIGFLGADVAIDRDRGPVFLELNLRPGLSIQLANLTGLKSRLERVRGLKIKTIERGVRVGMDLFGGEIEEELEEISGKRVIGSVEKVKLIAKDNQEIEVEAKIDTGAFSTSIDTELARKLGFERTIDAFEKIDTQQFGNITEKGLGIDKKIKDRYQKTIPNIEDVSITWSSSGVTIRPVIKATFIMDKRRIVAKTNIIDRQNLKYPMIIGKRDLKKFLIDVTK
ncbi:MAG: ATP-dependent zinc protease [Candidatus Moranbacteria bacterium]|nr:ATP-dependent zinc protease [Candidatus Moranbacteria bacterium]